MLHADGVDDENGYTVEHLGPHKPNGKGHAKSAPMIRTAAELRRKVFPPIQWIVPGYLAEGCTLLAGRPKLGKSWLALDIGLAVAAGRYVLGDIQCEPGDVLALCLEDNERRLQRRITKLLGALGAEWPARFQYATEWPRANEGGLAAIRDWIAVAENPRLVIVDVLAMFKPARGDKESLYEADYNALKGLQELAGEYGVAILVITHTRKSGSESGDAVEKITSTLGTSGAADAFLVLDRDGQGFTLEGRGRDVEESRSRSPSTGMPAGGACRARRPKSGARTSGRRSYRFLPRPRSQ